MLCSYCEGLTIEKLLELHELHLDDEHYLWEDFPKEAFYTHHPSFLSLVRSVKDGCELCEVIFDAFAARSDFMSEIYGMGESGFNTTVRILMALNRRDANEPERQIFDRLWVKVGFKLSPKISSLRSDSDSEHSSGDTIEDREYPWPGRRTVFLALERTQQPSPILESVRVGEPYQGVGLSSVENFDVAREWLRICVSEHANEKCPEMRNRAFPTRLVDIGSRDGSEVPRVVVSSGQQGLYAALSYCWGGIPPLKTTVENYEAHCKGLPVDFIPKTILDAMRITRELGFRYLWIDSLCIIQDSRSDWEQESVVMDAVYKNAIVTIAASASENCEVGIFDKQPTLAFESHSWLKLRSDSSECVRVCAFRGEEDLNDPLFRLPLARRGWTLQERLLSQRVLHYGRRRIYWQCRIEHISSDGNPPDGYAILGYAGEGLLETPQTVDNGSKELEFQSLGDKWFKIVESYGRYRELTFNSDKLPATSGIASAFQKLTGDEYIAGVWKSDWARGLLWQTWEYTKKVQDRAPSWSWASWDGHLAFEMHRYQTLNNHLLAKLIQHHVLLAGHNHLGEVRSGFLRLRGWTVVKNLGQISRLGVLRLDEYSVKPFYKDMGRIIDASAKIVYTMMIVGLFSKHSDQDKDLEIWKTGILLLNRKGGDETQLYERVGVVFHRRDDHGDFDMAGWTLQELTIV